MTEPWLDQALMDSAYRSVYITIDCSTLSEQLKSQVSTQSFMSDKIFSNSNNFRIKYLLYRKITEILSVLYFLFLHFFI